MKLLTVINTLEVAGAERLVVEMLPFLENDEVKTDLLLLKGSKTSFFRKLQNNTNLNIISLGENISVYNPILILKMIKYLNRYDLIHVHLFPALYWTAIAKMISFSQTKLIYTEQATYNRRRKNIVFKFIDHIIYRGYSKIVCVSDLTADNLKEHLTPNADKITVIYNGTNLADIQNTAGYHPRDFFPNDSDDTKYIIQVSAFRPQKDQKTVIRALGMLPPNYKLILIGDGVCRAECEQLSIDMNLNDRIYFLGIRKDVYPLLKMSDVIVLSSHYEGLSLSSIEGMMSGKPFVASRVPGLEDIIAGAGVLFECGDCVELSKIIERLTIDEDYRKEVIRNCLKRAELFDISRIAVEYLSLYKKILADTTHNGNQNRGHTI